MNPQFRNPPPGDLDPRGYDDPVTVPAGDIADNPYWKRDLRRSYPQLSTVRQGDVAGLLTVGSAASPKEDILQIGDAGAKQLVALQTEGEENGLAEVFKQKHMVDGVLGEGGLPQLPNRLGQNAARAKALNLDSDHGYPEEYASKSLLLFSEKTNTRYRYPCRTFS